MAEAAGWPAELSAADADQVQGSIRHCEGRLDRYRGALFTLVDEHQYIIHMMPLSRSYEKIKDYNIKFLKKRFGKNI